MKFSKTRQVRSPERGTSGSAGIDFFVPTFDKQFISDLLEKNENLYLKPKPDASFILGTSIILMPQDRILIPSGIYVDFTEEENQLKQSTKLQVGLSLNATNKSGVGSKKGLDYLASCVDVDYEGEVHINLVNTGKFPVKISERDKIIQFLLQPVFYSSLDEVLFEELYVNSSSERGTGGFSSTDKK